MSIRTSATQGNIASDRQMRNPWVRENLSLIQHMQEDDLKEICRLQGLAQGGHKRELSRQVIARIERLWTNGDHENYGRIRAMILHPPSNSLPQPSAAITPVGFARGTTITLRINRGAHVAGFAAALQLARSSKNSNPSPPSPLSTQVEMSNSNRARRAVYIDAATSTDDLDVPRNLKWWNRTPQTPPRQILPYHKFLKNIKEVKRMEIDVERAAAVDERE